MGLQQTSGFPHGRPRTTQEAGDQPSARDLRAVFGAVSGARGEYPLELIPRASGMIARYSGYVATTWDVFGFKLFPGNSLRIRQRTIRIHQIANIKVLEQDVALAGTTCWIYVSSPRPYFSSYTVLTSATEPVSNAGSLNVPLYCFTFVAASGSYTLSDSGRFDVNIDAPERGY